MVDRVDVSVGACPRDETALFELINGVCARPRMFIADVNSIRDVVMFVRGVECACGGFAGAIRNAATVSGRTEDWTEEFLKQVSGVPFFDACEQLRLRYQNLRERWESEARRVAGGQDAALSVLVAQQREAFTTGAETQSDRCQLDPMSDVVPGH